jgi:hypothetical protein
MNSFQIAKKQLTILRGDIISIYQGNRKNNLSLIAVEEEQYESK